MGILPEWFEQYWPGYSHKRLYAMVRTEAKGAGEVQATADEMTEFATLMTESVDDVEQALAEAGVSWQGLAAESMSSGVSPLAQWARDAATAAEASVDSTRQVGESFSYVSNAMPEPVPTPDRTMTFPPSLSDLAAAQQDHDTTERAAQEAKARAVELMDTYSGNSATAVDGLGTFVPPQAVTVATPKPTAASVSSAAGGISGSGGDSPGGDAGPAGPGNSSGPGGGPTSGTDAGKGAGVSQPPPGSGTDPARVSMPSVPNPLAPVAGPAAGNSGTTPGAPGLPFLGGGGAPGGGRGTGGGAPGGGRGGGGAPGGGRGAGGGPGGGRMGGGVQERVPGRGGMVGAGPLAGESAVAARGGASTASRAGTAGFGPVGAGQRGEEDKERTSPEYLRESHDDFWDDTPPVAPAVIGEDDD